MINEAARRVGLLVLVAFVFAFAFGLFIGTSVKTREFQKAAIQHGAAEYNSTNGNWQWKNLK